MIPGAEEELTAEFFQESVIVEVVGWVNLDRARHRQETLMIEGL